MNIKYKNNRIQPQQSKFLVHNSEICLIYPKHRRFFRGSRHFFGRLFLAVKKPSVKIRINQIVIKFLQENIVTIFILDLSCSSYCNNDWNCKNVVIEAIEIRTRNNFFLEGINDGKINSGTNFNYQLKFSSWSSRRTNWDTMNFSLMNNLLQENGEWGNISLWTSSNANPIVLSLCFLRFNLQTDILLQTHESWH